MLVLGVETSCDETAIAVVSSDRCVLSHVLLSQVSKQKQYGGVVPEVAAREHLEAIDLLCKNMLKDSGLSLNDIDAFSATCGPGLIGGVHVGASFAKTLSLCFQKPFVAVNHLAAHGLVPRIERHIEFPYLLLLASGGHCQILVVKSPVDFILLGKTIDDAAGEAIDKIGRAMGLAYPAGPQLEELAKKGDHSICVLPRPLLHDKDKPCDFSFSGLKTAARVAVEKKIYKDEDIAASLQGAISEVFCKKILNALKECDEMTISIKQVIFAGGVAANKKIRHDLSIACQAVGREVVAPSQSLCTDNGVMIAWAAIEMLNMGISHGLDFQPRPRWPLQELGR
jgi:N6-L-threonylcarbamoyladenine synthase